MLKPVVFYCLVFVLTLFVPAKPNAKELEVQIKGFDDGVKSSQQQDYKEAVLFAKRQAIERAGVRITSSTTSKDFALTYDSIETQAEGILAPGYTILDIGYQQDGTYLVVLSGTVVIGDNASNNSASALGQSQIKTALIALSAQPERFIYDLHEIGTYRISQAYFVNENEFAIHHTYKNGVITLTGIKSGLMRLEGTYVTDTDKGNVTLHFNPDGSAHGQWSYWIFNGQISIINAGF